MDVQEYWVLADESGDVVVYHPTKDSPYYGWTEELRLARTYKTPEQAASYAPKRSNRSFKPVPVKAYVTLGET